MPSTTQYLSRTVRRGEVTLMWVRLPAASSSIEFIEAGLSWDK